MIYEYKCECGKKFEIFCSISEMKQQEKCSCGKMAKKQFFSIPTHFKSRGFPSNDSRKRYLGDQVADNKVEDLFDDHGFGKKYGEQKDEHGLR